MINPQLKVNNSTILVVDDTPDNLRLLVGILKEKGYQVRPAPNGELALRGVERVLPDLILLDIMMPGMNGYEVCQKLKANPLTKRIPIIFISAINEVLDKVKAFEVGGVDYITKPFQVQEVLARVETHLRIRHLQHHIQEKNENLAQALRDLKTAQSKLVQSEKMAALGQLIAGIAHEINTPLGAICSSIDNIADFFDIKIEKIPNLFKNMSPEHYEMFLSLLRSSETRHKSLTTREKRKLRRQLSTQINAQNISNSELIADTLVDMGICEEIDFLFPLLQTPGGQNLLETAYQFSSVRQSTQTITKAMNQAAKVTFALKSYSQVHSTETKINANIIEGIEMVLTIYHHKLKHNVEVIKHYEQVPLISCYPDELNQVWTNLLHNALQAMDNRGTLIIQVCQQNFGILVQLTDDGSGIPLEIQEKIFDPFFTTKPTGEGSGLGLDIVKKIVEKHQGTIEFDSIPGQTTFSVFLPLVV